MLLNAFRPIFHFWEFENLHSFLIPLVFLVALAIQFFLFRQLKRPWLPIAVCGGLLLVGDIAVMIIVQQPSIQRIPGLERFAKAFVIRIPLS